MSTRIDSTTMLLRQAPDFQGRSDKELGRLSSLIENCHVPAGRVLCREGRAAQEAFLIVYAQVAVSLGGRALAVVGPGEFVGEMAMLDGSPRSATVVAATPLHMFAIGRRDFPTFISHPAVATAMATQLARRIRHLDEVSV